MVLPPMGDLAQKPLEILGEDLVVPPRSQSVLLLSPQCPGKRFSCRPDIGLQIW